MDWKTRIASKENLPKSPISHASNASTTDVLMYKNQTEFHLQAVVRVLEGGFPKIQSSLAISSICPSSLMSVESL